MEPSRKPRRRPGPLFWLLAILALAYLPLFFGRILFYRDVAHWNYPARWFLRDSILRGDFPSWNPTLGLGFSVFGNPLYGVFYPPNWLFALAPDRFVAHLVTWQSFAHVAWGSAGVLILLRRFGIGGAAGCAAGLAWGLSGYVASAWNAGILLLADAWIPWCGVGFVALVERSRGDAAAWMRGVSLAILPVAMALLLGEIFVAMMATAFGVTTALVVWRRSRPADVAGARRSLKRLVAAIACALILAGGIGSIVIIPARLIAAGNDRGTEPARAWAETCSFHPLRLIEFVAPGSMGIAPASYVAASVVGEEGLEGLPLMYSAYMGASVVLLALLAFGRKRRDLWVIGGLAALAVLISMGRHTPVHHWLRTLVPPLRYMRYPEKYLAMFVPWLALLAGLGAQRVLTEPTRLLGRGLVLMAVLVLLFATAPSMFPADWTSFVRIGSARAAIAVFAILVVQAVAPGKTVLASVLLVVVVAMDLASAGWPFLEFRSPVHAQGTPPAARVVLRDHRARSGEPTAPRVYRATKTEGSVRKFIPAPSVPAGEWRSIATLVENTATTFGLASLPGYDASVPRLLTRLFTSGQKLGQSVLRLVGVGYAVLPIDDPRDRVERRQGIEPMMDPLPGSRLYRVPDTLPRAYMVGRADVAGDEATMQRLFSPDVIAGRTALLAAGTGIAPLVGESARVGACRIVHFSNARIEALCRAEREAVAVFLEQFDRGWTAAVDGTPAPLGRANLLMRAVRVPSGDHTVVLSYTPPGMWPAVAISTLALVLTLALAGAPILVRRRAAL